MPFRFLSEKHGKLRGVLNIFVYATVTAVLTLSLASLLSGQSQELANRVDRNARVARAGVDTALCVLLIDPDARTVDTVKECADSHGYRYSPPRP